MANTKRGSKKIVAPVNPFAAPYFRIAERAADLGGFCELPEAEKAEASDAYSAYLRYSFAGALSDHEIRELARELYAEEIYGESVDVAERRSIIDWLEARFDEQL